MEDKMSDVQRYVMEGEIDGKPFRRITVDADAYDALASQLEALKDEVDASNEIIVDLHKVEGQLERQLADERWMHAACLTIAETGQQWGANVTPSLAMETVYRLYHANVEAQQRIAFLEPRFAKDADPEYVTELEARLTEVVAALEQILASGTDYAHHIAAAALAKARP